MNNHSQSNEDREWLEAWGFSNAQPKARYRGCSAGSVNSARSKFLKTSRANSDLWRGQKGQIAILDMATAVSLAEFGIVEILQVIPAPSLLPDYLRIMAYSEEFSFACSIDLPPLSLEEFLLPSRLPFKRSFVQAWNRYMQDGIFTDWVSNLKGVPHGSVTTQAHQEVFSHGCDTDAYRKSEIVKQRVSKTLRLWESYLGEQGDLL